MDIVDIARQVKESRKSLGWSQRKLAREANVTEQTIVNIERGHHNPSWKTIQKIAGVLSRHDDD